MFYLIGIAGENGVGKTTLAQQIVGFSDILKTRVVHESFATPIRTAARALGFSTVYGTKDTKLKKVPFGDLAKVVYETLKRDSDLSPEGCIRAIHYTAQTLGYDVLGFDLLEERQFTCRDFMIAFGQSAKKENHNIWLEALLTRVLSNPNNKDSIILIDDVRFYNEAKMCDKVIRLYNSELDSNICTTEFADQVDVQFDVNDARLLEKVFDFMEYKLV